MALWVTPYCLQGSCEVGTTLTPVLQIKQWKRGEFAEVIQS